MTSVLLGFSDVLEVVPTLTRKAFRLWIEQAAVIPVDGGTGHGNHARFSVTQTVGIAVAAGLRKSERGSSLAYVKTVVDAFSSMTEAELENKFRRRKTHLASVHQGKPLLAGPQYDWCNVEEVYCSVKLRITDIQKRLKTVPFGRPRGLATS